MRAIFIGSFRCEMLVALIGIDFGKRSCFDFACQSLGRVFRHWPVRERGKHFIHVDLVRCFGFDFSERDGRGQFGRFVGDLQ